MASESTNNTVTCYTICEVVEASANPLWTNPIIIVPNNPSYITPKPDGQYVKYLGPPWDTDKLSLIMSFVRDRPHSPPPSNWLETKCVIKSMAYSYEEAVKLSVPIAKKIILAIKRRQNNQSKGKRSSVQTPNNTKKNKPMTTYPSNVMGIDEFVQSKAPPRNSSEVMVFSVGTASSTSPQTGAHTVVDAPRGEQVPTPLSEVAINELHLTKRREETQKALFTVPSLMEPVLQSVSANSGVSNSGGDDENQENLSNDIDFDPDDFSWMNQPTNGEHLKDNAHDKDRSSHSIDQTYGIINRREDSISQTSTSPLDNQVMIINEQQTLSDESMKKDDLPQVSSHSISINSSDCSLASTSALVVQNDSDCLLTKKDLDVFGERLMKKIKKEIYSVVSSCFDKKCGKQLDTMGTDVKTIMNLSLNHFPQLDVSNVIPIEDLQAEYLLTLPMRDASHFAHFESLLLNNTRDFNTKLKRYMIATTSNTLDAVESMRLIFKKFFYKEVLALYTAQKPSNTDITKPLFTETAFYPALRDALLQVYNVGNVLKLNESCIKKAISSVFNAARTWTTPNNGSEDAVPKSSSG